MRALPVIALLGVAACTPRGGPGPTAEAYEEALREGRLDEAWEALDPEAREALSREAWQARWGDPAQREAEAERVGRIARPGAVAGAPGDPPALVRREGRWYVLPPPAAPPAGPEAQVRAVLERFVEAASNGDFDAAWRLLAPDLRARYTAESLARDHRSGGREAVAAVARIRAALEAGAPVVMEGDAAYVRLGGGRSVRLVREGDAWRVADLH